MSDENSTAGHEQLYQLEVSQHPDTPDAESAILNDGDHEVSPKRRRIDSSSGIAHLLIPDHHSGVDSRRSSMGESMFPVSA